MSSPLWRKLCLVLGVVCCFQTWRLCQRTQPQVARELVECPRADGVRTSRGVTSWGETQPDEAEAPATTRSASDGFQVYGFTVPGWAMRLLPQPGENLRTYRDRLLPLAQMAVAPHRARVARGRDDFAERVGLDARQRAELDAAAEETATAIQDRLFNAVLSGELAPSTFKPMAGVAVARDVLDLVDHANRRFLGTLRDDQRDSLALHPFDFADYLVFSTRWEDAISAL